MTNDTILLGLKDLLRLVFGRVVTVDGLELRLRPFYRVPKAEAEAK